MIVALYKNAPILAVLYFRIEECRPGRSIGNMPDNYPVIRPGDVRVGEEGDLVFDPDTGGSSHSRSRYVVD